MAWCEQREISHAPQMSLAVLDGLQRWLRSYRKADGHLLAVNGQLHRLSCLFRRRRARASSRIARTGSPGESAEPKKFA